MLTILSALAQLRDDPGRQVAEKDNMPNAVTIDCPTKGISGCRYARQPASMRVPPGVRLVMLLPRRTWLRVTRPIHWIEPKSGG